MICIVVIALEVVLAADQSRVTRSSRAALQAKGKPPVGTVQPVPPAVVAAPNSNRSKNASSGPGTEKAARGADAPGQAAGTEKAARGAEAAGPVPGTEKAARGAEAAGPAPARAVPKGGEAAAPGTSLPRAADGAA